MTEKQDKLPLEPYYGYKNHILGTGSMNTDLPSYITDNIKYDLRYYQKEAHSFFDYYLSEDRNSAEPDQLLYHMATGSGKTVVMGCKIIKLYKRGYRNFIFFVDKSNIVEKKG